MCALDVDENESVMQGYVFVDLIVNLCGHDAVFFIGSGKKRSMEYGFKQKRCRSTIIDWLRNYRKGKHTSVVLYGPSGVGKDAMVRDVCKRCRIELFEIDTSDQASFERSLVNVNGAQSCFEKGNMVIKKRALVVESGDNYRPQILKLMRNTTIPLFCVHNGRKRPTCYQQHALAVEIERMSTSQIAYVLTRYCERENLERSVADIAKAAKQCEGDVRQGKLMVKYGTDMKDAARMEKELISKVLLGDMSVTVERLLNDFCDWDRQSIRDKLRDDYLSVVRRMSDVVDIAHNFAISTTFSRHRQLERSNVLNGIDGIPWMSVLIGGRKRRVKRNFARAMASNERIRSTKRKQTMMDAPKNERMRNVKRRQTMLDAYVIKKL